MKRFLVVLIIFIFMEIAGVIVVGNGIGVMPTLVLIITTTLLGAFTVKKQGTKAVQELKQSRALGQAPGATLVDKFLLFSGAILLIFPGFITDLVGLFFLLPTRRLVKPVIFVWLRKRMKNTSTIIVQR